VSIITSRLNPGLYNYAFDTITAKTNAKIEKLYYLHESNNIISYYSDKIPAETIGEFVGRPVAGTKIYILHNDLQLVPPGIDGQLYISKNNSTPINTNTKNKDCVPNPYEEGTYIINTNKKARWLVNGEFAVFDQDDHNFRIANTLIVEIRYHIQNCPLVSDSVVTVKTLNKNSFDINIYWVKDENTEEQFALQTYLEQQIVTSNLNITYFEVPLIPLDPQGNINMDVLGRPMLEARTKVEKDLLAIWQDILETENIGIQMPFFQMGGNSIKALQLVSKINKQFNQTLLITDIFNMPSIEEQAQYLDVDKIAPLEVEKEHINPRNSIESDLERLFSEVLEVEKVGVNEDFFDIGGNRLNAIQLISQVNKHFDMNFHFKMLFTHKSISQLAVEIEAIQWVNSQVNKVFEPSTGYIEI